MNNLPAHVRAEMDLAKALATSELLPRDYRLKPANVLLTLSLGRALGIEPAVALTNVTVIEGKPTFSSALMAALVRRAGHVLRVTQDDSGAVTATLIRADDPTFEHRCTWTMDRAAKAGLTGKGAWRAYPSQMLTARAITEVVRLAASDVLMGAAYDPEELDYEDTTVEVIRADEPNHDPRTGEILEVDR